MLCYQGARDLRGTWAGVRIHHARRYDTPRTAFTPASAFPSAPLSPACASRIARPASALRPTTMASSCRT